MTFIYVRCEWAGPCRTAWTSAETKSPNYCTIPHHHKVELPSPAKYSRTRIGETKAGLSAVEHLRIEYLYAGDEWPVQDAVPSANCKFVSHMKSTPDVLTCCIVARAGTGPIALDSVWHELTESHNLFRLTCDCCVESSRANGDCSAQKCYRVSPRVRWRMMFQPFVQRTFFARLSTEIQR